MKGCIKRLKGCNKRLKGSHIQKPHQMTRYLGGNLQKLRKFWVLGGNFVIFKNNKMNFIW